MRVASDHNGVLVGSVSGEGFSAGAFSDHGGPFGVSEKDRRFGWGRNSLVEQVIIGLTVFFAVVVLVALLIVFLMRGNSGSVGSGIGSYTTCGFCFTKKSEFGISFDKLLSEIDVTVYAY